MISKAVLFVLGLSILVVVISSNVQGRDLVESSSISRIAEVDKEQNEVGITKYASKACIKGSDSESSDCFMFPGFPGIPGFGTPGFPGIHGFGTPGTSSNPKFVGDIKYGSKACIKGSGGESSDCFIFPGFPGFPGIPGFGTPGFGTPGFGTPSSVDIPRSAGDVKYGSKTCIKVNGVESSDCFIFPGFGFPGIPQFPSFPGFPSTPLTPPITPITPIAP